MQKENRKLQRIDSDIYRIIATFIQERGISADVVDLKTSADLSECKVYVTAEVEALSKASSFLRSEVAQRLNLKNTPKFKFIQDKGRENAARVEELLEKIRRNS